MKDLKDKVVAITGGATGIGFSFAKQFGREGAKIILTGRREDRLQQAVEQLQSKGITARYFCCDVTQRQEMESFADFAWEAFGHVDVLINNAGTMTVGKTVVDSTVDDFMSIYNVNIIGVLNGCSVFGKHFIERSRSAAEQSHAPSVQLSR
jgi:NADP-dependent 3-hydroxy acid dehydrogenase YdfG